MAFDHDLGDLSAYDCGVLWAHRLSSTLSEAALSRELAQARRSRGSLWTWLLPNRRRYLDGLVRGLAWEQERRAGGG